ncbi:protein SERAC1 [Hydra vulgaris]|nr:protein SERAC1 [Hydra vulgaris]
MFTQKLKTSCKYISIGFGFFSSYITYNYQNTIGKCITETLPENFNYIQKWMQWKTKSTLTATEIYMLHLCHVLSNSPMFHRYHMTSLLIYLASSEHKLLQEISLKLLSVVQFPDEIDVDIYVKKCSNDILVGLARSKELNLKWFLPFAASNNNSVPNNKKNTLDIVSSILEDIRCSTHFPETNCSIWLHNRIAGEVLPEDPIPNIMADFCTERDNVEINKRSSDAQYDLLILKYLDVLRKYSNNESVSKNRRLSKNIIAAVKSIIADCKDDNKVLFICGSIIANLAVNLPNRNEIIQQNLIAVFAHWRVTENLMLNAIADRVLFNLDYNFEKSYLSDGVYICHPNYRSSEKRSSDIIFIHGINGSPFYTWRLNDSVVKNSDTCWPKDWLSLDHPTSRIFCIHYESYLTDWMLACPYDKSKYSLDEKAISILAKLKKCGVGDNPIVWVCHSMGGLIVKKLLLSLENKVLDQSILQVTKGIMFYSVPHLGSPIATRCEKARYILFPSIEVNELSENSAKLRSTHSRFLQLIKNYSINCTDLCEVNSLPLPYLKINAVVVPRHSCDVGYGRFVLLDANHQDICKPHSKTDPRYLEVNSLISKVLIKNEFKNNK